MQQKSTLNLLSTLLALLILNGCKSPPINDSKIAFEPDMPLDGYLYVAIYDAEEASFIEQNLSSMFRGIGFKVIGENEAPAKPNGSVLGVRYTSVSGSTLCTLTVLLEDYDTDRTIITAEGRGQDYDWVYGRYSGNCISAWNSVRKELLEGLPHLSQ